MPINKIKAVSTIAFSVVAVFGWAMLTSLAWVYAYEIKQSWKAVDSREIVPSAMTILSIVVPAVLWRKEMRNSALTVAALSACSIVSYGIYLHMLAS